MTMPSERTRALRWAGELLRELQASEDLSAERRREIQGILRHYPSSPEILDWAQTEAPAGALMVWLAPEDAK